MIVLRNLHVKAIEPRACVGTYESVAVAMGRWYLQVDEDNRVYMYCDGHRMKPPSGNTDVGYVLDAKAMTAGGCRTYIVVSGTWILCMCDQDDNYCVFFIPANFS